MPLSLRAEDSFVPARSLPGDPDGRIDLNHADRDTLMTLPGIGGKTADAILEMREKLGYFRFPEDLLLVKGIGNAKLKSIYDLVYAEPID